MPENARDPLFNSPRWYRLDGHDAVPMTTRAEQYAEWERREQSLANGEDAYRVARTAILDSVFVSTVFLGLDHQWMSDLPPLLFETMVFGLPGDHYLSDWQERCSTWEQAEKQHASIVEMVTDYVEGELKRKSSSE